MPVKTTQRMLIKTIGLGLTGLMAACNSTPSNDTDQGTVLDMTTLPEADLAKPMLSFFITSRTGSGNLGGLAGADTICKNLATVVGAGSRTWAAYLSATGVNARDRIGAGPWYNTAGTRIATDVNDLHQQTMGVSLANGLDENGGAVPTNQHDIITGSNAQGMLVANATCVDWTSEVNGGANVASVGHFNRAGGGAAPTSWNAAHNSQGCTAAALVSSAGAGRFYCFATD